MTSIQKGFGLPAFILNSSVMNCYLYKINLKFSNSYRYRPIYKLYLGLGFFNSEFHTSQSAKKQNVQYGLNKMERRNVQRRLNHANETAVKEKHLYKSICAIDNKYDLANYLKASEIFNDDGLIALNKPYGISRYDVDNNEDSRTSKIVQTLNSSGNISVPLSVENTLPLLKEIYKEKKLTILLCPERWSSGILLLGCTDKANKLVKLSIRRSIAKQLTNKCYWVVTSGLSDPLVAGEKVANYLKYVDGFHHVPVIKKTYSNADVKRGHAKPNVVEHKVLAYKDDCDAALVEINVLNNTWHFLRVWMSNCGSPILGDLLYGGRVKKLLGKKVILNPQQISAYEPPELNGTLLEKLKLNRGTAEIIPCHIHLAKVKLDTFYRKETDLEITAPPPKYFMWTCKQLGLMDDSAVMSLPAEDQHASDLEEDFADLVIDNKKS